MNLTQLNNKVINCELCPRLRSYCLRISKDKRKAFKDDDYWGKPVIGFGDHDPKIVLIGLAPAAHGANRTGRMFTGDRSGEWLYRALYEFGFSNKSESTSRSDGLILKNAYITAAVRCAPPDNKPTTDELENCSQYLWQELGLFKNVKAYIGLGKIGFDQALKFLRSTDQLLSEVRPKFFHGVEVKLKGGKRLIGSYHPSQQNTFTGRLTKPMFDSIFALIKRDD